MKIAKWLCAAFVFSAPAAISANFENATVNADFDLSDGAQPTIITNIFYTELGYSYITRSVQPYSDAWLDSQNFEGYAINVNAKTLELGALLNDHAYDTAEDNAESYKYETVAANDNSSKEHASKLSVFVNTGVINVGYSF